MCGCSNRLKSFMQNNGFTKEGGKWTHPSGLEYTEKEVSTMHTRTMARVLAKKVSGKL